MERLAGIYHRVVLLEAERLAAVLSSTGSEAQLKPVRERLAAMWGYFTQVSRPDGYGPLNNDGDWSAIPGIWSRRERRIDQLKLM